MTINLRFKTDRYMNQNKRKDFKCKTDFNQHCSKEMTGYSVQTVVPCLQDIIKFVLKQC